MIYNTPLRCIDIHLRALLHVFLFIYNIQYNKYIDIPPPARGHIRPNKAHGVST